MGFLLDSLKDKQEKDFLSKITCEKDGMPKEESYPLSKRLMAYKVNICEKEAKKHGVQ